MAERMNFEANRISSVIDPATPGYTPQCISLSAINSDRTERDGPDRDDREELVLEIDRKMNFFHPGMSRHIAECVLLENGQVGSYLLRTSTEEARRDLKLALSVRCFQSVKHYEISWNGNEFKFGMGSFNSVDELVEHFTNFPVIGGDSGVLTMLKFPYPRSIDESSIYDEIRVHAEWKSSDENGELDNSAPNSSVLSIASKEGYLTKIGLIRKSWKLRWFVCLKMQLSYYDNKGDLKPIRKIDLNSATACNKCEHEKQHCFELKTESRIFLFHANSDAEALDWIRLLKWKIANNNINN